MNAVIEKIKSRGYWHVIIRPLEFLNSRIHELGTCRTFVRDNKVILRGWDYPHYDERTEPTSGLNFVEQFTDWQNYIEGWRLYQSGQFVHCKALIEDWFDARTMWGEPRNVPPRECLSIIGTVYLITEIYEFASRLANKKYLGEACHIKISLRNTKNRMLTSFDASRFFIGTYQTTLEEIPRHIELSTAELIGRSAELALEHVVWLYQRFNWDNVKASTFKEEQCKLMEKRL